MLTFILALKFKLPFYTEANHSCNWLPFWLATFVLFTLHQYSFNLTVLWVSTFPCSSLCNFLSLSIFFVIYCIWLTGWLFCVNWWFDVMMTLRVPLATTHRDGRLLTTSDTILSTETCRACYQLSANSYLRDEENQSGAFSVIQTHWMNELNGTFSWQRKVNELSVVIPIITVIAEASVSSGRLEN